MSRFKVGDKAMITSDGCIVADIGETVTITRVEEDGDCRFTTEAGYSCYGHNESLELITTKGGDMEQPKQRRTFRLLKDMPTLRKGAVLQEQCEDGTQPYEVIASEFNKDKCTFVVYDRSLVEDQPKWFVEVFKVTPEYQTRDELDQWEAFKSRKKPGRKAAGKATTLNEGVTLVPSKAASEKRGESKWTPAKRRAQSRKLKAAWAAKKAAQRAA